MKTGRPCPKCGAKDPVYFPGGKLEGQNNAMRGGFLFNDVIRIARYVCRDCGFTEEWVDRDSDMDVVRRMD